MVTLDRIRLTGLLRKKPWERGFFYGPGSPATRQARPAAGVTAVSVEPLGAVARRGPVDSRSSPFLGVNPGATERGAGSKHRSIGSALASGETTFVHEERDDQGSSAGIRYGSRLGDEFVDWGDRRNRTGRAELSTSSGPIEASDRTPRRTRRSRPRARSTSLWPLHYLARS